MIATIFSVATFVFIAAAICIGANFIWLCYYKIKIYLKEVMK